MTRWVAKSLEYPIDDLPLDGPTRPWELTARALVIALVPVVVVIVLRGVLRRLRAPRQNRA